MQRSRIGNIIDSNDTWILGCLLYLKITFNIRWGVFFSKEAGLSCLNFEIFRFLTGLGKKVFKVSAIFRMLCKTFITFYERIFF